MQRKGYLDIEISPDEICTLSGNKISKKNIVTYCSKANANQTPISWINRKDPNDNRKILILYSSIPANIRNKYNLPTTAEMIERCRQQEARRQADAFQMELEFRDTKLKEMIAKAAKEEYLQFVPKYNKAFPGKRDKAIMKAKTEAVIACCIDMKGGYKIKEIHEVYLKTPGIHASLKSLVKFGVKLKQWQAEGIQLVHAYNGKPRPDRVKMTAWHTGKVEQYYAHPNKWGARIIHELLTKDCIEQKKQLVSVETVAKYIAKPAVKNRLAMYRDKAFYNRNVQPSARRLAPVYAGDLYYADGSPSQIPCWNETGTKVISLNIFVVMDVMSKKLTGFDLSENEDRYNWLAAFKMAFNNERIAPFELVYDNASATKTAEFLQLKNDAELKGCRLRPTTKGEPRQKADVERFFGTFQELERLIEMFTGEGIRTKRDNGRIDVEHLSQIQKIKGHYEFKDMVKIITTLIQIYNHTPGENKLSPAQIFEASEKPNTNPLAVEDIAYLFWTYKKIKVANSEVKITIRHNEYYYEVYDHRTALRIDTTQVKVYYDAADLSTVHLFSLKDEYICECRQKLQFHKAQANQTPEDVDKIIKTSAHYAAKKTVARQISEDIARTAMQEDENFLNLAVPYTVAKEKLNQTELNRVLRQVGESKGIDLESVKDYEPAIKAMIVPKEAKESVQERQGKRNIKKATLEVVGTI